MEYSYPLLVSSNPNNGAVNVNELGSRFDLYFDTPYQVPKNAKRCFLNVEAASVWWNVPNISNILNNDQFSLTYFDGFISTPFNITIPKGLYDLNDLNEAINRELVNDGAPNNLITLIGDNSTQKTVIQFNPVAPATISIDFTISNSIRTILGFNSQVIPASSGPISFTSDNVAQLNSIDYFLIHSNLVGKGLRIGNNFSQVICQVLLDVPPGSQQTYEPPHPLYIDCNELIGRTVSSINVYLTDNNNNLVDTNGEYFSCRFSVHYVIEHEENKMIELLGQLLDEMKILNRIARNNINDNYKKIL
jgi:hypothetical protein